MSLSSALKQSTQVKFFDMSVFFIVSLITYRYFEINERGILSIFWATFFIIELFIIEFGSTTQAKIPDYVVKNDNLKIQNLILSTYFIRSISAFFIGLIILLFVDNISLIITPEGVDYLRTIFVLKVISVFFILNILFGPIDHSILIGFKKYKKMKLFYNIKVIPLLISAFFTLGFRQSPEFMILVYIFVRLILQIWMGWHSFFYLKKEKSIKFIKNNLDIKSFINASKHGLPIWVSSLMAASIPHMSILILGQYSTLENIAQYSLAISLFMAAIAFLGMFDGWLVPKLSEIKSQNAANMLDYINDYYRLYFYASTLFGICIIIFSNLAVRIIAGDGYENSVLILIALCCFINLRTLSIFRNIIVVLRSTNIIPVYVFIKFIIEIFIMVIMVPKYDFYGILIAQFISFLVVGQLWIRKVFFSVFNKKNNSILFYNKYLNITLITSLFFYIIFYLYFVNVLLFYLLLFIYLAIVLWLFTRNLDVFRKTLSK